MTSNTLSNNLNLLMAEARINANELARRTGIPASSIKKIRNDNNPNPTLSTLIPIANYFSITVSQLIGDIALPKEQRLTKDHASGQQRMIPIISWDEIIHWPVASEKNYPTVLSERKYSPNGFGLLVIDANWKIFSKGTLLLIEPDADPLPYDYVLVKKDKQSIPSLKQILIEDGEVFFKSVLLDDHVIPKSREYQIIGVVIEYRKYLRQENT